MSKKIIGVVILTGGHSSRMGTDKANLEMGGYTFLERMSFELSFIEERLLSVNKAQDRYLDGFTNVIDEMDDIGPIGGIYAALKHCKSEALLVVACDMPFFTRECAAELIDQFEEETAYDACMLVTSKGEQPLAAIYNKTALPVIKEQIRKKDYRLKNLVAILKTKKISCEREQEIVNINTPLEFQSYKAGTS